MPLFDDVKSRDTRAIARALTLVESGDEATLDGLDALWDSLPTPARVGVTGPPGSGKSTLVSALVAHIRESAKANVGVVAVDPSSPFSGGALLGDRLRMAKHTLDPGVYVRSMASRGAFGGLASATETACDVLSLAGFDPLIVETVGVGQSEVDIARLADTTVVVLTPASGDSVQALKAGIMEIADVVAINKSDLEGSERIAQDVRDALELRPMPPAGQPFWMPPVLHCVATNGQGVTELYAAVVSHRQHLVKHNLLLDMRGKRAEARLRTEAQAAFERALGGGGPLRRKWDEVLALVRRGEISPRKAATLLEKVLNS